MNKITTIQDLLSEIGSLEELLTKQKNQIKVYAEKLKESLQPINILYGLFTSLLTKRMFTGKFNMNYFFDKVFTSIKRWFL